MGRPLKKDVLGTDAIGTPLSTATGIRIEAYTDQAYTDATYNITTNYAYICLLYTSPSPRDTR